MKQVLAYALVAALLIAVSIQAMNNLEGSASNDARKSVATSGPGARAAISVAVNQLRDGAEDFQARSALPAYLRTLKEFRDRLMSLERDLYAKYPYPAQQGEREDEVRLSHQGLVDAFVDNLVDNLNTSYGKKFWENNPEPFFRSKVAKQFVGCSAFAVNKCFYEFAYYPFTEYITDLRNRPKAPRADLLLAVDDIGVGLADSTDDKWSDVAVCKDGKDGELVQAPTGKCPEGYQELSFAAATPILAKTMETQRSAVDIFYRAEGQKTYLARTLPLTVAGEYVGSVLLGFELDRAFVDDIRAATRLDVQVVYGNRVVASTVMDDDFKEGGVASIEGARAQMVTSLGDYTFVAVPLVQNSVEQPTYVVLATNVTAKGALLREARSNMLLGLIFFFLISLLFGELLNRAIHADFETIDHGIHEIIGGNNEFEFPYEEGKDGKESMANSMSQSLNLMLALLLGRPLPEDEEELVSGIDALYQQAAANQRDDGGLGGDHQLNIVPAARLREEPAEDYFKRLHKEYLQARESIGMETESVTYNKFQEKLVRAERKMKEQQDVHMVRFNVIIENEKVTLEPVFIEE